MSSVNRRAGWVQPTRGEGENASCILGSRRRGVFVMRWSPLPDSACQAGAQSSPAEPGGTTVQAFPQEVAEGDRGANVPCLWGR
jgi:hypothetical protein